MLDANNFYRMSTATTISNSGLGTNTLTKPAGTEVASIVPGKKWSVHIPTPATFTTDFNADGGEFTFMMYTKPSPGVVINAGGHSVVYTGYSFYAENELLDRVEIPVSSTRAHLVSLSFSSAEVSLRIDGEGDTITSNVIESPGPMEITLLESGGILDNVEARLGLLSTSKIKTIAEDYRSTPEYPVDLARMSDEYRDWAMPTSYPDVALLAGNSTGIPIASSDSISFRIDYLLEGVGDVVVNGVAAESGTAFTEAPQQIYFYAQTDAALRDIVVTEYYGNALGVSPSAAFVTTGGSGNMSPVHKHDDSAGTTHDTVVTLKEPVNTISGWFYAQDGAALPGVSMNSGVLTGTGLYVNGKPYAGGTVKDWYFLTKTGATSGEFTTTVPVHSYITSVDTLNAEQIDDLYENFFGNVTLTADVESISLAEGAAMIVSSEWSIISSG